jgi:prenyltransferase beta subunit
VRRPAAILALCALVLANPVLAAAPSPADQARLDSTVRYLQEVQQSNGGFGAAGEPSQISSAWVALALAAAGINPRDQALPGGVDAFTFLATHFQQGVGEELCAPIACTTAFERELMVVNASGTSPHDFAGVDLAQEILDRELPDGAFPFVPGGKGGVNVTIFAILSLAPIQEAAAQAPIQRAADWVEAAQQDSGGWSWKDRDAPAEVDMTGAAIQALVAAGRDGSPAELKGLEYLRKAQNPDGGFPEFPGDPESNVASTAWAVQAIWAAGANPEAWLTGGGGETEEPLDYMESLQAPDGHIRWKKSSDVNGVWMTAYVAPAYAGQAWPIPAAPRALKQQPQPPQSGQGGGEQSGSGVIAGGGSAGAPLFSRPKPQSKGRTPGGARVVRNGGHPIDHSKTRRGGNTEQPAGTVAAEAAGDEATETEAGDGWAAAGAAGTGRDATGTGSAAATVGEETSGARPGGDEVSGDLIGSGRGVPAFGAPGLHGAGAGEKGKLAAIGIAGAALMLALLGAQLERRRGLAIS